MHENREISWTSWSSDQDRSAKAINRKADTNVQEKSDCAVVAGNQPNNERQLSAETGEGRAQTQENIVQSHMRPTQSGKRMSQGLPGVRQAARERKERVPAHSFLIKSHLDESWCKSAVFEVCVQMRCLSLRVEQQASLPGRVTSQKICNVRMQVYLSLGGRACACYQTQTF